MPSSSVSARSVGGASAPESAGCGTVAGHSFASHSFVMGKGSVQLAEGVWQDPEESTHSAKLGCQVHGDVSRYGPDEHTVVILRHTGGNRIWESLHLFWVGDECQEAVFVDDQHVGFDEIEFSGLCLRYLSRSWQDGDVSVTGPSGRHANELCMNNEGEYELTRTMLVGEDLE